MDCQASDSKKLFKVFDASKRKRSRKKRDGLNDSNSVATDGSNSVCQAAAGRTASAEPSLQNLNQKNDMVSETNTIIRGRGSSPDVPGSREDCRSSHSPRRHRRPPRDGMSLALKAGLVSTPRSITPRREGNDRNNTEISPRVQDSFIYTFLEEAIKKDKKKQRQAKRHESRRRGGGTPHRSRSRDRDRDHRHHHRSSRRKEDRSPRERSYRKESVPSPAVIHQAALFETFAKICTQMNERTVVSEKVTRALSHKSLQCEVEQKQREYEDEHRPAIRNQERLREDTATRIKSQDNMRNRGIGSSRADITRRDDKQVVDKCACCCEKEIQYYSKMDVRSPTPYSKMDVRSPTPYSKMDVRSPTPYSKMDVRTSTPRSPERYREYPPDAKATRSIIDTRYQDCRERPEYREYREYDDRRDPRTRRPYEDEKQRSERLYEDAKPRLYAQKTSRSFDVTRDDYVDDDRRSVIGRRTTRSDNTKDKRLDDIRDKRYDDRDPRSRFYDDREMDKDRINKDKLRPKRNKDSRYDRASIASRDEDYRERFSERERDSGLSVADGENSTISGRSNYLRAVKQEIVEQREAMDKMMKLWKELMRCFKGISSTQSQAHSENAQESAANARDSAEAQLRLWRECMRRYETVARDVGDTDARLMEEINKQRSEMAEMASMWQECLQRYREMSNDFNSLKQQVTSKPAVPLETASRMMAPPLICAEGEGSIPPAPYHLPHNYPPPPPMGGGYMRGGSPLRSRASAPPAWWWGGEPPRESPRRRSSPDSRGSRDRDRRHRHKDRDDTRYKEKSSKPSGARSEHRHRKR